MNKHKENGILVAGIVTLLLPLAALPDNTTLTRLLDGINNSLGSAEPAYRLTYDPDFPCSITISQDSRQDTTRWLRSYRFELSDMLTGQMIMARDGRRAISYYGEKTTVDGEVKTYAPKKISTIAISRPGSVAGDNALQQDFDRAIRICEEKNRF